MDREQLTHQIGKNIRKMRLQQDLSQESLALSAGMHPAYFGRLERGEKCPTIDTLYKICNALNISIYELLDFQEEKPKQSSALYKIEKALKNLSINQQEDMAEIIIKIINTFNQ